MNIDYFASGVLIIGAITAFLRIVQIIKLCRIGKADLAVEGKGRLLLYSVAIITLIICYIGYWAYAGKALSILVLGVIFFVVFMDRLFIKLKKEL